MGWKVFLYDDEGNEFEGTTVYRTKREADEDADASLDGCTYIGDSLITAAAVEEV